MKYNGYARWRLLFFLFLMMHYALSASGEGTEESASKMLVIGPVNPYTDADCLNRALETLDAEGYPCLLVVKPVYAHVDYPGMSDLIRVICCAQKNGTPVFLAAPAHYGESEAEALEDAMTAAMEEWMKAGVYPTGLYLTADEMFDSELAQASRRFSTLLVRDAEWEGPDADRTAEIMANLLGETEENEYGRQILFGSAYPEDILQSGTLGQFVMIDWTDLRRESFLTDFLHQRKSTESLMYGHPLRLDSRLIHRVSLGENTLIRADDGVLLNNAFLPYMIPESTEETFNYQRGNFFRSVADIARESQILIYFSGTILILFLTFIWMARRQMHRRFIHKSTMHREGR